MKRVYAMCATGNGLDVVERVLGRMPLSGIIGLSRRRSTDAISGLVHAGAFCEARGLDFVEIDGYGLDGDADQRRLFDLSMDLLLVPGWQRLLPDRILAHCRMGAVGVHGSAAGITRGRRHRLASFKPSDPRLRARLDPALPRRLFPAGGVYRDSMARAPRTASKGA